MDNVNLREYYVEEYIFFWFGRCGSLKIYSKSQRNKVYKHIIVDDSQRKWKIFKDEDKI